ncbi:DUF1097 domain-containing protein [Herminiimonas sp. KBW02]|uniref:DUF1097 domain-containing protein n=1 Tax=Herminiimonas sp. KBW02 TaxID=2153363 RepID=UPI000F5B054C|nr:DUF1097 domain-containing protein [Herminiimonas sp. KBW02]RQO34988.1 DUF1097 domain-containing protein [Herminiimonas sp. KBW02]
MKKPPHAVVASLLAVTTVLMVQLPWHLPVWAIFVSWAGTFAMGGPTIANMKRIWPTLAFGSFTGFLVVTCFGIASKNFSGTNLVIAEMIILFILNTAMIMMARVPGLSFVPGMFFGFASFFATMFGGFGPTPKDPLSALGVVIVMNALGPIYAWITANFSHRHVPLENTFPAAKQQQVQQKV